MKKRTPASSTKSLPKAAKSSLRSPFPTSSIDRTSKPYDFDLTSFIAKASSKKTLAPDPSLRSPSIPSRTPSSISELRDLASSVTGDLKRHLDVCHSEVLKEIEASKTRISKRFKIQTQACLQLTEETEKDYKKISDRISENSEVMKASYAEFMSELHATTSRASKVSIPELAQSLEKNIEGLRSRYGISSTRV